MQYTTTYQSPLGEILLAADTVGLTGLWFEGGRNTTHSAWTRSIWKRRYRSFTK
ncbi:MAG: hypothetical protein ACLVHV_09950 [Oscillospiraceae bacterium]